MGDSSRGWIPSLHSTHLIAAVWQTEQQSSGCATSLAVFYYHVEYDMAYLLIQQPSEIVCNHFSKFHYSFQIVFVHPVATRAPDSIYYILSTPPPTSMLVLELPVGPCNRQHCIHFWQWQQCFGPSTPPMLQIRLPSLFPLIQPSLHPHQGQLLSGMRFIHFPDFKYAWRFHITHHLHLGEHSAHKWRTRMTTMNESTTTPMIWLYCSALMWDYWRTLDNVSVQGWIAGQM